MVVSAATLWFTLVVIVCLCFRLAAKKQKALKNCTAGDDGEMKGEDDELDARGSPRKKGETGKPSKTFNKCMQKVS